MAAGWFSNKWSNTNQNAKRIRERSGSSMPARKRLAIRSYNTNVKLIPSRYAKTNQYVELKYQDNATNLVGVTAGAIGNMIGIANGTGPSDRIGNHISMKDLVINYLVTDTGGTSYAHNGRFIIVQDLQTNKATAALTDVMISAALNSQFNPSNRSRFKVLMDENYSLYTENGVGTIASKNVAKTNKWINLRGKKITYSGTTSAITDIDAGTLLYIHLSDTASKVTMQLAYRFQFYD